MVNTSTRQVISTVATLILLNEFCIGFILTETTYELCLFLLDFECPTHDGGTVCGSDAVTYTNECELTKVICRNESIRMEHTGPCEQAKLEQELVLNVTCRDILQMECYKFTGGDKLCASDNRTYSNECYFEKARCVYHGLYMRHYGECTVT